MNQLYTKYFTTGMPKISLRFILTAFVVGACVGTTGDFVHVYTKTTGYPANGPFPFLPLLPVLMPIWVPVEFGLAVVLMAVSHKLLSPLYTPRLAVNRTLATWAPVLFTGLYAMTGLIQLGVGGWQDAWIAAAFILLWWFFDRTVWGIIFAIIIGLIGSSFEIFLTGVGGFFYYPKNANFMGVASWLPWLYMSASICVSLFVRWLD